MKRPLAALAALLWTLPALAQMPMTGAGKGSLSVGAGCAEATSFIARTSGAPNTAAYTTMICGLVTDGVWAKLDVLYVTATDSASNALLNLKSASFTATTTGSPPFTANTGYVGNGTSATLNSGFNFSLNGVQFTQNSASLFSWTILTINDNGCGVGEASGSFDNYLQVYEGSSKAGGAVNGGLYSVTVANGTGLTVNTRTGATALTLYRNAASIATGTGASGGVPSTTMQGLMCAGTSFASSNMNLAAWGNGGALTGTDVTNLYNRLHTYLNTVNAGSFP